MARMSRPAALAVALLFANASRADEPVPAPAAQESWSHSRRFVAVGDPAAKRTRVFRVEPDGRRTPTWSMKGWFRVFALADDGEHLVTGHDGMGLLPVEHPRNEALLVFFRRGVEVARVTLRDLLGDAPLRPTASHLYWGHYGGLDERGRFFVDTVDGRRLAFDVMTGRRVEGKR